MADWKAASKDDSKVAATADQLVVHSVGLSEFVTAVHLDCYLVVVKGASKALSKAAMRAVDSAGCLAEYLVERKVEKTAADLAVMLADS